MSCNLFLNVWGCGNGCMLKTTPLIRLTYVITMGASLFILPNESLYGILLSMLIPIVSVILAKPSAVYLKRISVFTLIMFIPVFLLIPFISSDNAAFFDIERFKEPAPMKIALSFFVKSLSSVLLFFSFASSLKISELGTALKQLKLPNFIRTVILQIINQIGLMYRETIQISQAISLRGSASGIKIALQIIRYSPVLFLYRMEKRAQTVSNAMLLRGYMNYEPQTGKYSPNTYDIALLIFSFCYITLSIWFRWSNI